MPHKVLTSGSAEGFLSNVPSPSDIGNCSNSLTPVLQEATIPEETLDENFMKNVKASETTEKNSTVMKMYKGPEKSTKVRRSIGEYQFSKTLGAGSMGKVKLGIHMETGEKVAIKVIPRVDRETIQKRSSEAAAKEENKETRVIREAAIMSLLDHPNIVKMKEMIIHNRHYYLILEYVSGGQMLDYIISHGRLKEKQARNFARQICSALEYCHKNSIVHRDLKIENILIADDGSIKLIDFGLSNLFSTRSHLSTFCGSLYFAAPELLHARAYTGPEVDIWSMGIVLYVLVCGKVPFDDQNLPALHAKIKKGHVEYPTWLSSECKHLLSRMLVTNPSERATMAEVMRHVWMNKGFDGPPNNFFPVRKPIQLPLNMEVIRNMTGFEFGSEERIRDEIEAIVRGDAYQNQTTSGHHNSSFSRISGYLKRGNTSDNTVDHPLLSIYHLVKEKMEKEQKKIISGTSSTSLQSIPEDQVADIPSSQSKEDGEIPMSIHERSHLDPRKTAATGYKSDKSNKDSITGPDDEYANNSKHRRSKSTTASGVFRRISQAIKSGRRSQHKQQLHQLLSDDENNPDDFNSYGAESNLTPMNRTPLNQDQPLPDCGIDRDLHTRKSGRENLGNKLSIIISRATSLKESNLPRRRRRSNEETTPISRESSSTKRQSRSRPPFLRINRSPTRSHSRMAEDREQSPTRSLTHSNCSHKQETVDSYVKPVFLKGLFSVATTSTKKPAILRTDIIRILDKLGFIWREGSGYFECILSNVEEDARSGFTRLSDNTNSSVATSRSDEPQTLQKIPEDSDSVPSLTIPRGATGRQSSEESGPVRSETSLKPTPSSHDQPQIELEEPTPTESNYSSTRFRISIVKIPWLPGLHGIRFRRLAGHPWEYKNACSRILNELKL
ncbi:Serine/threonine-protein kinase [Basidiobolus ranarum]|uniref:non-specific serine/threonine protein kinase n=1 Tax=Basidiobolus ranarum TaxID=34480 RepID=A0ABR2WQ15_9FUNG